MSYEILVVDDEVMMERIFEQRLRKEIREGLLTLHFARSAQEALTIVDRFGYQLVLILTDINMPGMSGLELLKQVRSHYPQMKIYISSAYDNEEYRQQALSLGADGWFSKPMDFSEFKALLEGT
ncbi:MAG: response regulator [Spirochaetales bacterium]|nr:response regulator [Spirochaetales bacterium]